MTEWKILDAEAIQDPEVLLELVGELLEHQRCMETTLAMVVAIILGREDVIPLPGADVVGRTFESLKEYLLMAQASSRQGVVADQIRDLLEAKE
jgi:hypothetical protein